MNAASTPDNQNTGPVYGSPGSRGAAPVPPPPPPGYAAPGYQPGSGSDGEPTQYTPIIPGQAMSTPDDDRFRWRGQSPQAPSDTQAPGNTQASGKASRPPAPPANPTPPASPAGQLTPKEIHQWAAGAHAGGLLAWIPVVPLIPAIAIYAVYKDRSPYIKEQALEAINFQLCILLAWVAFNLIGKLPLLTDLTLLVWAFSALFAALAAVAALRGARFRYPLTHRFIH